VQLGVFDLEEWVVGIPVGMLVLGMIVFAILAFIVGRK
jgi:hypothetical protein